MGDPAMNCFCSQEICHIRKWGMYDRRQLGVINVG